MTYIRRLELKNFKSSGVRALNLNFEKGFTVITGPNGSGKSNIADAILFAIGENSPRQLRAANGKLSGLIYDPKKDEESGRSTDRPASCRVTIQFENLDRAIPLDSDVVTVGRELRENGENIYYLNGRKVTRTALSETLDLAGLSPGGLNIVPQGSATKVADYSREEKRKMIENVAGIAKFEEKKAEAQRQLGQADQRLEVALARIGEMKSTLDSLELQKNDLMRFNILENQINWLRAVRTSKRILEQGEKLASLRGEEAQLGEKLRELSSRMAEFEDRISQVDAERTRFINDVIQGGGANSVELKLQYTEVDNELQNLEADLQDEQANIASLETETLPSLKQVVASKEKEVSASRSVVSQLHSELLRLDAKREELTSASTDLLEAADTLRETIDKKAKQLGRVQVKLSDVAQRLNSSELEINAVSANLAAETKRLEELKLKVDSYSEVLQRLESNSKRLFELFEGSTKELGGIEQSIGERDEARTRLLASIDEASGILEKAASEVARESALRQVSESISGERTGQEKLQEFCENGGVPGYVGRLGALVKYPQSYSKAVSAMLGRWMGAFVVKDTRSMTLLIKAAKSLRVRAFSVIPLTEVSESAAVYVGKSAGVIGPLSSVIRSDERDRGLINFLAGDTVLVETEAMGYLLASEGLRAVTLQGEVFEGGAKAFSYGYQDLVFNVIEGLADIEGVSEVENAATALRKAIQKRKGELGTLELASRSLMKDRVKRIASVASLKAESNTIARMSSRYNSIFRSITQAYEKQTKAVERLSKKFQVATERRDALQRAINSLQGVIENTRSLRLDEMLRELESSRKELEGETDAIRNRAGEVNLRHAREKANLENILERALEENRLDLESALADHKSAKEFVRDAPKSMKQLTEERMALEEQIQKLVESSKRSQPVLDEFEGKLRRLKEERDALGRSASNTEKELFSVQNAITSGNEKIEEALGSLRMFGYSEVLGVFDSSEYLLSDLEKEYETVVTSVNRGAERQYREMYQNYKNLSVRHNELEKERIAIITFIENVEAEKRKVFMTAFDRIRNEFEAIFSRLANGEAKLELENEEDIFAGGVMLRARFGTKPFFETDSLSGGEKAVSGVALILAMQGVQSHPFYLFDEIDSALDAVNSGNLAHFLKERSGAAQIIAITLRDMFVEESDVTYGAYASGGVSRLVHYRPAAEVRVARG